jgi:hypothetical protein
VHGFGAVLRKAPYIKGLLVAGQKLPNPYKSLIFNGLINQLDVEWIGQAAKLSLDRAADFAVHNSRLLGLHVSMLKLAGWRIVKRDRLSWRRPRLDREPRCRGRGSEFWLPAESPPAVDVRAGSAQL